MAGAPEENTNAEKWNLDNSGKFFLDALELSKSKDYDFIGEIARDLGQYIELFDYLTEKFPELKTLKNRILSNCAANCFSNGKKGNIIPSMAIMNLKSNHGWTDRVDNTTKDKELSTTININPINWVDDKDD